MRAWFCIVVVVAGCSSQETQPAPDASLPRCNEGPFVFCQAVPASEPSCSTDDPRFVRYLSKLPKATSYPVDCSVNFVGDRDEQGNCRLDAVCKCVSTDLTTLVDAGEDASPTSVTTRSAPTWNCFP
jgi:hypothetical protein